jgi:hypothetical protein
MSLIRVKQLEKKRDGWLVRIATLKELYAKEHHMATADEIDRAEKKVKQINRHLEKETNTW